MTKALVVGYGSIGKRHALLLKDLGCELSVVSRHQNGDNFYPNIASALEKNDIHYVVIANETLDHLKAVNELVGLVFKGKVLVEKPLFSRSCEVPSHEFESLSVAYNLRFHPALQALKEMLKGEKVISAQLYVGQYLPDWRPDIDYRICYSADIKKGGGVLRDLSHELDVIHWLFGDVEHLCAIGGKLSNLDINSDDSWGILGRFSHCPLVTLQLNYLDRIVKREIVIQTQQHTYHVDLLASTLNRNGEIFHYSLERNTTYLAQHRAILDGDYTHVCTAESGLNVVNLIERIEQSACQAT